MKVLSYLMEYTMEDGQSMSLVAASWWSYWSNYAALTLEEVQRVREKARLVLGLDRTQGYLDQAQVDEPLAVLGAGGGDASAAPARGGQVAAGLAGGARDMVGPYGAGGGNGNGHAQRGKHAMEGLVGAGNKERERAVPTMLARRPHEIDNSSLQVSPVERNNIWLTCSAKG